MSDDFLLSNELPLPTVQETSQPLAPEDETPLPELSSSAGNSQEKIAKDFIEDARKKCLQGNYKGALEDCLQAIEMNPFYSKAHRQQGMALYLSGNLDDAEIAWKKAWECDCRR